MDRVKIIAKFLTVICWILAGFYLVAVSYSAFCLLTGLGITPYGEGKFLHINFPFTNTPFLNVDNNLPYLICSFILVLSFYGLFFLFTGQVFRIFHQARLFIRPHIITLQRFYRFNLLVPGIATLISLLFVPVESIVWGLVLIHMVLGTFAYFLSAIFKQGLHLQNEQDLFI
jgi:hypothetical protein